jgi:hypothetical protein
MGKLSYHYKIVGLNPRTDIDMGRWGFNIELDINYAIECCKWKMPWNAVEKTRLNELAAEIQNNIWHSAEYPLFPRRHIYNFWEDTVLLTNVRVDEGSACGLDMDHNHFKDAMSGQIHEYSRCVYLPHNVDGRDQALSLLTAWINWYDCADILMECAGKPKG